MKCAVAMFVMASLAAYGQKIETQKADRFKITRLATTVNHLSVLEFSEPVKEVAIGSSAFKIEWRENKVFVQPLEPGAATNLFIWTNSGRQSYELVPAGSIDEMHFAIDEDPVTATAKREDPPQTSAPVDPPKVPPAMLMGSVPIRTVGPVKSRQKVEIVLEDVYQEDSRIHVRYAIANGGSRAYLSAIPAVVALKSPHAPWSLVGFAHTQLTDSVGLRWKDEAPIPVIHGELRTPVVRPGETIQGIVTFDIPPAALPGQRTVVAFRFPEDGIYSVSAVLVL